MGGVRYPNSLRSYNYGPQSPNVSIEYNLNRDCKTFRGTAGLDDHSPTGSYGAGGAGHRRHTEVDRHVRADPVRGGYHRRHQGLPADHRRGEQPGAIGAVGTPQVLCSF